MPRARYVLLSLLLAAVVIAGLLLVNRTDTPERDPSINTTRRAAPLEGAGEPPEPPAGRNREARDSSPGSGHAR